MIDYPKKAALGASSQGIAAFPGPQYDKIVEIIDALNGSSGGGLPYGNDVGVADAYQVAIPNATLTDGYTFEVNIGNNNTGASTLQVNALGIFPIVDQDANPITLDMLVAGSIYLFAFNTASYQLLGLAKPLNNAFVNNGNAFGGLATLGTLDNNDLAFISNNTEWMRITASGDVGIGTATPLGKLGVVGTTGGGEKLISLYSSDWATPGEEERFYLTQGAFYARANTYDLHAAGGGDATFTIYGNANGTIKIWSDAAGSDTFSVIGGNMPTISSLASGLMFTDASWTFGNSVTPPTAKVHIIGATSDNTTYALKVENSSTNSVLYARNDGNVYAFGIGNVASNTSFGLDNLASNTTGSFNTVYGVNSMFVNTTGSYNTAVGNTSLHNNNGSFNTATGYISLELNNTGERNTAFGYGSLSINTSGIRNTAIGMFAGNVNVLGDDNIFIGYNANPSVNNLINAIAIGSQATVSQSNTMALGNNVDVIIGGTSASARLHVVGVGSSAATYTIKAYNSVAAPLFTVNDIGASVFTSNIEGEGSGTPMFTIESTAGGIRHNYVAASTYATIVQYYDGVDLNAKFHVANGGVALMYMEQYQFRQLSTNNKWLGINTVGDILIGDPANIYAQTARLHVLGSDATAANYGFKVGDNVSATLFSVRNDGQFYSARDFATGNYAQFDTINYIGLNDKNYISINEGNIGRTSVFGLTTKIGSKWSVNASINPSYILFDKVEGAGTIVGKMHLRVDRNTAGSVITLGSEDLTPARAIYLDVDNNFSGFNYDTPSAVVHIKGKTTLAADTSFAIIDNAIAPLFSIQNNGLIKAPGLQVGNAGLVTGDLYVDTAANILLNGDLIVARKV